MENREDLGELFLSAKGMKAARRPLGEGIRGDSNAIVGLGEVRSLTLVAACLVSRQDQGGPLNYRSTLKAE